MTGKRNRFVLGNHNHVPPVYCPYCGAKNDAITPIIEPGGDAAKLPEPGNISLCFICVRPAVFDEHGRARKPTEEEAAEIKADSDLQELIGITMMMKMHPRPPTRANPW